MGHLACVTLITSKDSRNLLRLISQRRTPTRRIVVVATTFPGHPGDGTPEFVLTLAKAFCRHEITVVAPRVRGAPRHDVIDGIEVRRVRYWFRRSERLADDAIMPALRATPWLVVQAPSLVLALMIGTLREVVRQRPVVVHAHWIVPAGAIAWLIRSLGGPPYVLTVHGADAYTLRAAPMAWIKRGVLRRASAVMPVSRHIARTIGRSDAPVLRMGVDTSDVAAAVMPRKPDPSSLLFVGRLAAKKGVDVLLEAVACVPDVRLVLIGDGPLRTELVDRSRRLGVDDRVTFLGRQGRAEVFAAMRTASAVVLPSVVAADGDMEGTPVVLAEAMAAGVPVIASDLGGIGECVEHGRTGLLVTAGDVDSLATAIRMLVGGQVDVSTMVAAAQQHAALELDIHVVAEHYEHAIERIP